jgi:hypothetical protein
MRRLSVAFPHYIAFPRYGATLSDVRDAVQLYLPLRHHQVASLILDDKEKNVLGFAQFDGVLTSVGAPISLVESGLASGRSAISHLDLTSDSELDDGLLPGPLEAFELRLPIGPVSVITPLSKDVERDLLALLKSKKLPTMTPHDRDTLIVELRDLMQQQQQLNRKTQQRQSLFVTSIMISLSSIHPIILFNPHGV